MTKVIIYDNFLLVIYLMKALNSAELRKYMKNTDTSLSARLQAVEQLRAARKSLDITQEVLAERVGTKKSNISRLESGKYNPSLDFLVKVADSLGKQIQIKLK